LAHRRWLAQQSFEHPAQQSWSMAPVVDAYQAMRGASFLVAVTFAAEIGDVRRFDTPRQLMSFLGLVPAESSTGDTVCRKGLTLARISH
jgi:transposase